VIEEDVRAVSVAGGRAGHCKGCGSMHVRGLEGGACRADTCSP
jgi:hypothetical protein